MDITLINSKFEATDVIDEFSSLIWTSRYYKCGDFEMTTTASTKLLDVFRNSEYVTCSEYPGVMLGETIELTADPENGDTLKFSGRSLEAILSRRCIIYPIEFTGNFQDGVKALLDACIIKPKNLDRKISNFIFKRNDDPRLAKIQVSFKFYGDDLLTAIEELCEERKVGFRITLTWDNKFEFGLYLGEDRSYDQVVNPMVSFSPEFENIVNSNYLQIDENRSNVAVVSVKETDSVRNMFVCCSKNMPKGLSRREMFVVADHDATDDQRKQAGLMELTSRTDDEIFEGEVDLLHNYKYGEDFFIGDIVQMTNEYGISARTRVTEFVYSESDSGIEFYPSFEVVKEE